MNDLQLQQAVLDELEFDPCIEAAHVGAFVHEGVVTLTGYVTDYAQKHAAEDAARRIKGVRAIAQELEVRLPNERRISDDEIAIKAIRMLDWDLRLGSHAISVTVEDGVVRLTGHVPWDYQRRSAENDVRKLGGVVNVINHLAVRPTVSAGQVQQRIASALERNAALEAGRISVKLDEDGAVILAGQVDTLGERDAAESAAWAAPGVSKVVNRISVGV